MNLFKLTQKISLSFNQYFNKSSKVFVKLASKGTKKQLRINLSNSFHKLK